MSESLETLQATLPAEVQNSILGSALQEVYVFVINNSQANNLKTSLKKAGLKNISSKTENGLTTVTAQKKHLFPSSPDSDSTLYLYDCKTENGGTAPNRTLAYETGACADVSVPDDCVDSGVVSGCLIDLAKIIPCAWESGADKCVTGPVTCDIDC